MSRRDGRHLVAARDRRRHRCGARTGRARRLHRRDRVRPRCCRRRSGSPRSAYCIVGYLVGRAADGGCSALLGGCRGHCGDRQRSGRGAVCRARSVARRHACVRPAPALVVAVVAILNALLVPPMIRVFRWVFAEDALHQTRCGSDCPRDGSRADSGCCWAEEPSRVPTRPGLEPHDERLASSSAGGARHRRHQSLFAALFVAALVPAGDGGADVRGRGADEPRARRHDEAPRGRILDRNGRSSSTTASRSSSPSTASSVDETARRDVLARLTLGAGPRHARSTTLHATSSNDQRYSARTCRSRSRRTCPSRRSCISQSTHDDFPASRSKQVAVRVYPLRPLAAHVLGYVGAINDDELRRTSKSEDYSLGDEIGKAGVEQIYEDDLRGTPGSIDARGRRRGPACSASSSRTDADPGRRRVAHHRPRRAGAGRGRRSPTASLERARHVRLEGRRPTHFAARRRLGRRARPERRRGPRDGVVPDVRPAASSSTASTPSDCRRAARPDQQLPAQQPGHRRASTRRARRSSCSPLLRGLAVRRRSRRARPIHRHRHVHGARLQGRAVHVQQRRRRAERRRRPADARSRCRATSTSTRLGARFWRSTRPVRRLAIQDTATAVRLRHRDRRPAARRAGRAACRPREQKQAAHDQNPDRVPDGDVVHRRQRNSPSARATCSSTPLQLANAYATFANGGTLYSPNIASRGARPDDRRGRRARVEPRIAARQVVAAAGGPRSDPAGLHRRGRLEPSGTAATPRSAASRSTGPVAGKTGTAQVTRQGRTRRCSSAFGPADDPQYVVAAVLEESGFGGRPPRRSSAGSSSSLADPALRADRRPGRRRSPSPVDGLVDDPPPTGRSTDGRSSHPSAGARARAAAHADPAAPLAPPRRRAARRRRRSISRRSAC